MDVSQRQARKTLAEIGQSDTLLEGRANAFTVDIETKMQNQINQLRHNIARSEEARDQKIIRSVESVEERMAAITERFDMRFRTNDQLKRELDQQMQIIVKSAVNEVSDAFIKMNDNNKKAMEKLTAEIESKGFAGEDEDRLELQRLRDKTLYEYMDTLVSTAKIGLEAQIRQIQGQGHGSFGHTSAVVHDDSRLLDKISQVQDSMTELKDTTLQKIEEESRQRVIDLSNFSMEAI